MIIMLKDRDKQQHNYEINLMEQKRKKSLPQWSDR